MSHKIKIIKKEIYQLFIKENLSATEISKIYNCSNITILNWIRRFGLGKYIKIGWRIGRKNPKVSGILSPTKRVDVRLKMVLNHANVSGKNNPNYGKGEKILGELNGNWKGGIKPFIKCLRDSDIYNNWRLAIYKLYNYTCQDCGERGGKLHAHHNKIKFSDLIQQFLQEYKQFSLPEDKEQLIELAFNYRPFWDLNNGILYCEHCHAKLHPSMNYLMEK